MSLHRLRSPSAHLRPGNLWQTLTWKSATNEEIFEFMVDSPCCIIVQARKDEPAIKTRF